MKDNNFEDQFREAFSMHEPNLSTDEIWKNVEPHLKKKKKRRFFFFWWLIGGLGLTILGYGLHQWLPNRSLTVAPVVETTIPTQPPTKAVIFPEEECPEISNDHTLPLASMEKKSFVKTRLKEEAKSFVPITVNKQSVVSSPSEIVGQKKTVYSDSKLVTPNLGPPKDKITEDKSVAKENDSVEENQSVRDLKDKKTKKSPAEKSKKEKERRKDE